MIQNAIKKSNITYSVSTAEDLSQFSSNSIDLVTAAQAAHWFNMAEFFKESFRVLKPHGTLAIWGYSYNILKDYPDVRQFMKNFINDDDKLGPYWDKGVGILDNLYKDIKFPKEKFQNVKWEIYEGEGDGEPLLETEWTISQLTNYFKINKNFYSIKICHKLKIIYLARRGAVIKIIWTQIPIRKTPKRKDILTWK